MSVNKDKKKMTHEQCRQKICILCLEKKKSIGPISLKVRDLIKNHISGLENFENDQRLPNAMLARKSAMEAMRLPLSAFGTYPFNSKPCS